VNSKFTAVIMAAGRGDTDPVARHLGTTHKCLAEISGTAILDRVIKNLDASAMIAGTVLCIEDDAPVDQLPYTKTAISKGRCRRLTSEHSAAASAYAALQAFASDLPLLIVTGDHPLLSTEMVDYFCRAATDLGDVVVGLARAQVVLGTYPESVRTLLRFSDGPFCGCNLYAFNTTGAGVAARFWERAERSRKRPWRLVGMFGLPALLRYVLGRLELEHAIERVSKQLGIGVYTVLLPWPEAAIDVDKPADLTLAEAILERTRG